MRKAVDFFIDGIPFHPKIRVSESGCWEWQGARTDKNYGSIYRNGKNVPVHRYTYEGYVGSIPPGMLVCHKCDNPPCCNPEHLFLGTSFDNVSDMIAKGRKGNRLTADDVRDIRERFRNQNITRTELSIEYGVGLSTISDVVRGKTFKNAGWGVGEIEPEEKAKFKRGTLYLAYCTAKSRYERYIRSDPDVLVFTEKARELAEHIEKTWQDYFDFIYQR